MVWERSTVLSAINLLYAPIRNKLTKQRIKQTINIELGDIKSGKASAEISAEYILGDNPQAFTFRREITYENKRIMVFLQNNNKMLNYGKIKVVKIVMTRKNICFEY